MCRKYETGAPKFRLTKTQAPYIAGFVDGEGCIDISNCGKGYTYATVSIGNTHFETMEWLAKLTGVKVTEECRRESMGKRRFWYVRLSGRRAAHLLRQIYPFLRVKREQARVVLDFAEKYHRDRYNRRVESQGPDRRARQAEVRSLRAVVREVA